MQRKKRILLVVGGIVILLALLVAGAYVGVSFWIKDRGITLRPAGDFAPVAAPYFLQTDPEWADDRMGGSGDRMAGSGCLVCCIASSLSYQGRPIDPGRLNALFSEKGVYDENGQVVWARLTEALGDVTYTQRRVFTAGTLAHDLAKGVLPLVKVNYRGGAAPHWVLVVGAEGGEFLVMDPLNAEKQPLPLSVHGKVRAYRLLEATSSAAGDAGLAQAFSERANGLEVEGQGTVSKLLSDDTDGARHQRFIVRLASGQTLLVAHNIDIAPRVSSLQVGDTVSFKGEYEWNAQGGLIHWTHHDPDGGHAAAWIRHDGRTYQ